MVKIIIKKIALKKIKKLFWKQKTKGINKTISKSKNIKDSAIRKNCKE